ncbi:MAG TPA: hypothetical protein VG777_07040, partial [Thermoanaerobaculia bacterium]|nr:hypothetical protein [Thermoanaerobaculia bacterium]
GVVDDRGRVLARVPADTPGAATAEVAPSTRRTVWTRGGGAVFPGVADLAALAVVSSAIVRGRRSGRA